MDAFLPGVPGWEAIYNDPAPWHFRFYGPTPVALVKGRERLYFERFWNDLAADRKRLYFTDWSPEGFAQVCAMDIADLVAAADRG